MSQTPNLTDKNSIDRLDSHSNSNSHEDDSPKKPRSDHIILIEKPKVFSQTFSGRMFSATDQTLKNATMSLFTKSPD